MKIIVKREESEKIDINFAGGSFEVIQQKAIFESDDGDQRFPFVINLQKGQKPYPAGDYRLSDDCFEFDGKKKIFQLARELKLVPLKSVAARAVG